MFKRKLFNWFSHDTLSPSGEIDTALALKKQQKFAECKRVLNDIAENGKLDDQYIACYELALLNSQMGHHVSADIYLKRIGFKYKLSPLVFHPDFGVERYNSNDASLLNRVAVIDNVVPCELLISLRNAFGNDSAFWSDHAYPTDQFFSYNIPMIDIKSKNNNLLHQLVSVLLPIVSKSFPNKHIESTVESVEWWCHIRSDATSAGHQLHFDLDEVALKSRVQCDTDANTDIDTTSIHPLVSSVLYLNETCDSLAPTLVTNQVLSADSEATDAWLCQPAENRLLLFDGAFLHGVVPYLSTDTLAGVKSVSTTPRITLMIGWWGAGVHTSQPKKYQHHIGPNMRMPSTHREQVLPVVSASKGAPVPGWNIIRPPRKVQSAAVATKTVQHIEQPDKYYCPFLNTTVTWPLALRNAISIGSNAEINSRSVRINTAALHPIEGPVWVPVRSHSSSKSSVIALRRHLYGFEYTSQGNEISSDNVAVGATVAEEHASEGCVEFMTMTDLNALRQQQQFHSDKLDAKLNSKVSKSKLKRESAESEAVVEYISIADLTKLREVSTNSKSTAKHGNKRKIVSEDAVVEYMSIADLNKLRGGGDCSATAKQKDNDLTSSRHSATQQQSIKGNRLVEFRQRKKARTAAARDSVMFFGRWFLRSKRDIYDEVVNGCGTHIE